MKNPYYDVTVPVFTKMLTNLDGLITKSEEVIKEKGISESKLLDSKLADDMLPFVVQIRIACDNAKGAVARLAGIPSPKMEDEEKTLAELHERIAKTIAFLKTLKPAQFEEATDRKVELPYFKEKHFMGHDYLVEYALPNFFFHVTVAYAILRSLGAQIGKADYVGELSMRDN